MGGEWSAFSISMAILVMAIPVMPGLAFWAYLLWPMLNKVGRDGGLGPTRTVLLQLIPAYVMAAAIVYGPSILVLLNPPLAMLTALALLFFS